MASRRVLTVTHRMLRGGGQDDKDMTDDAAGAANDDPQLEEACLFLAVLSCLVCCCFSTCIVRRLRRLSGLSARYLSAELTAPLLDDTDHDAFISASPRDGYWTCPVCELQNRSSRSACDICGLSQTTALKAAADLKKAARKCLGELASSSSSSDVKGQTSMTMELPARQKRAARRRRWVRRDGVWRLSAEAGPELEFALPVVASFHEKAPKVRVEPADGALAAPPWRDGDEEEKENVTTRPPREERRPSGGERDRVLGPMRRHRRHRSEATDEDSDELLSEEDESDEDDDSEDDDVEAGHRRRRSSSQRENDDDDEEQNLEKVASLPFHEKVLYFEKEIDKTRTLPTEGHARLEVRRVSLLEESVQQLLALEPADCKRWMRVQFVDEPGIDVGGIEREWFGLVAEALFDENVGAFRFEKSSGVYAIAATAMLPAALGGHPRADELFEFTGRFLAKAVLEHVPLGASLAPSVLKQLLGRPLEHDDLQDLDETLASNVAWLLANDGVGDLDLDFSVAVDNDAAPRCLFRNSLFLQHEEDDEDLPFFGDDTSIDLSPVPRYYAVQTGPVQTNEDGGVVPAGAVVRELVRDGRNVRVDDANKLDYAQRLWRYHLVDAHRRAVWHLAKGFYAVLPPKLLTLFDEREFDLLVCGSQEIDVDDWAKHTEYAGDYRRRGAKHTVIVWFWKLIRDLDHAHRAKLLQYCTGSNRLPCHGFKALQRNDGKYQKFSIHSLPRNQLRFPRAHTCFNRLDLPLYSSKAELEAGLKVILAMDTTGFTMD